MPARNQSLSSAPVRRNQRPCHRGRPAMISIPRRLAHNPHAWQVTVPPARLDSGDLS
jgi:hypothetical protein